jgi:protein O-GlcNAc transferase
MPSPVEMRINQAAQLINQLRWDEAERILVDLKAQHPLNPFINYNLGNVFWEQKRLVEAARCFRQALAADPSMVPAMVNLSGVLQAMGDRREALRYIQMALRRQPGDAKLLSNLGMILMANGEAPDALAALADARRLAPTEYQIEYQYACCLHELHRWGELKESCTRLWDMANKPAPLVGFMLMSSLTRNSAWAEMPTTLERIRREMVENPSGISPLMLAFLMDEPALMKQLARQLTTSHPLFARPSRRPPTERITVGYLSPDYREHPVAHMILSVLRQHDRQRFRILTIGSLPPDQSGLGQAITAATEGHIDLSQLDDDAGANAIRNAGVDVLVDLAGSTQWSRPGILARRSCPVQLLWLGCPCTTGMPWYDALLVDDVVADPGYEQFCTEPLLRLPCCYHPISTGFGTPDPQVTRTTIGMPEDAFVIGLRLQPAKIIPPFTEDLVEILRRCPDAHLWLKTESDASGPVRRFFNERGISPERIITNGFFRDRAQYLASFRLADLLIDAYPYGGHSTTGEALAQGLPVVTRMGASIHTRVAGSMLHQLGLPELATTSREEFLDMVCRLSTDRDILEQMRQRTAAAAQHYAQHGLVTLINELERTYTTQLELAPAVK